MNKFVNTKTGKLYTAYSIREIGDKYVVVFKKGGKSIHMTDTPLI